MKIDFILRRFHSFLGIIPLYFFLFVKHIPHTAMQFLTGEFIDPPMTPMIILGIMPFVLHGIIGVYIIIKNKMSVGFRKTKGSCAKKLQITSAVIMLMFVISHSLLFEALRYSQGYTVFIVSVAAFMLGIAAFAFHIGYGTYTFCLTWGFCANPQVRKIIRILSVTLGVTFEIIVTGLFIQVFINIKGMLGL